MEGLSICHIKGNLLPSTYLGFCKWEPDGTDPAGTGTSVSLSEWVLQAWLHLFQFVPLLQEQPLRSPPLYVWLHLPQTEGGAPQEPGQLGLQSHFPLWPHQEEEEDEDGLR